MLEITKLKEFTEQIKGKERAYLLVFKKGTGVSDCAFSAVNEAANTTKMDNVFYVDAPTYPEIHKHFGVTSAPSLLVFEKGQLKDMVKGCHDAQFYRQLFENAVYQQRAQNSPQQKSVTVYSTPTCPWCNTLKSFLRKNGIVFTDIDVSRDHEAARQMVSATGQQGVPQANIGGEWVVGFDQQKIKRLLNIQTQ
ncbi:glutaredoxin domain-containing protein [Tenuifilum osseticum]|uniref:glutaredoxin domain-containing protein n=1 Tax=Tenuifilum osseticum TaxID=3374723 RepID=UPI0034E54396